MSKLFSFVNKVKEFGSHMKQICQHYLNYSNKIVVCCLQQAMAGFSKVLKIITKYDYLDFIKFTDFLVLLKTETKAGAKQVKMKRRSRRKA